MYIQLDLTSVPPVVTLHEADDFTAFKVVADLPDHAWVGREALTQLAGPKADDPEWREGLDKMLAYADSKGWTNDAGAIRAHVEPA